LLFPRAAVVVHQAGIGTLAQALRSGRPQLIVPFYADQMDNASRAVGLGVARRLAPERYDAKTAGRELEALTRQPQYGLRAAQLAGALAGEDGAARGARIALNRIPSRHST
jgi:UDP:flavonoid glycosyltransferase YjiC (YdhE family)